MNSLPSLKRSTLGRWLVITAVIAALPLSAIAQLSYRMAIKSVQIVNWSAPKITEITAGYLVKVRVEGEWIEGNISGADVTILVDDQIVLSERQNFCSAPPTVSNSMSHPASLQLHQILRPLHQP